MLPNLSPLLDDVITDGSGLIPPPHDGEEGVDDQLTKLLLPFVDGHGRQVPGDLVIGGHHLHLRDLEVGVTGSSRAGGSTAHVPAARDVFRAGNASKKKLRTGHEFESCHTQFIKISTRGENVTL